MRVLLPSDNASFLVNFLDGYRACGAEPVAGRINFDLAEERYDILHLLWPEELTGWVPPTPALLAQVVRRLDWWAARSRVIVSVNNIEPHGHENNAAFDRLYAAVFERADVIHHFSDYSRKMICAKYPAIAARNHVVRVGFSYSRQPVTTPEERRRGRAALGVADDEVMFLSLGALRQWSEAKLILTAFRSARVPGKRLVVSTSKPFRPSGLRGLLFDRWRRAPDVTWKEGFVPDEALPELLAAADAIVVARQGALSSGIPSLAMSAGQFVIVPDDGAFPEYMEGTGNLLYEAGSSAGLAAAMERAATVDRRAIGAENAVVAKGWNWPSIISTCLDALPARKTA